MTPEEKEAFRAELRREAKLIRAAFKGEYASELQELYALSKDEIDALVPGTADLEEYAKLIEVVKLASQRNLSQAELKAQIVAAGDLAVQVAKLTGGLAKLFV